MRIYWVRKLFGTLVPAMMDEPNGPLSPDRWMLGTGRCAASRAMSSTELEQTHGLPSSLEAGTGVAMRRFCDGESQIDMAVEAALRALSDAGLKASDLDLIIHAAAVPYQPIPATAPAIQRALGLCHGDCFAMDINSTCLGFPVALQHADALLRAGAYRRILVVSSEIASRGLPWRTQPEVAGLFGDGAGAAIVAASDQGGLVAAHFATWPLAYEACEIGAGGTRFDFERNADLFAAHSKFSMDGTELFRVTARHFAVFVDELLTRAKTEREQIDRVIAHQASPGALAHMIRMCGFRVDQVVNIAAQVGNQVAASIPFTLDYARENGLVKAGDRIAILGTSAGVSFGGLVVDV
jgi:3-oxoacyl-[acyl-carrier-protein] synthase III